MLKQVKIVNGIIEKNKFRQHPKATHSEIVCFFDNGTIRGSSLNNQKSIKYEIQKLIDIFNNIPDKNNF